MRAMDTRAGAGGAGWEDELAGKPWLSGGNTGSYRRGGGWAKWIVGIVLVIILVGHMDRDRPVERTPAEEEEAAAQERQMQAMLNSGRLYSIDRDRHRVRVDTLKWFAMKIEGKQRLVQQCSVYFKLTSGNDRVEICSDRDDTILGEYSRWDGLEIHH